MQILTHISILESIKPQKMIMMKVARVQIRGSTVLEFLTVNSLKNICLLKLISNFRKEIYPHAVFSIYKSVNIMQINVSNISTTRNVDY